MRHHSGKQALRSGIFDRPHGVCRTTRYDKDGNIISITEQTPEQRDEAQRILRMTSHMSKEERENLLRELGVEV